MLRHASVPPLRPRAPRGERAAWHIRRPKKIRNEFLSWYWQTVTLLDNKRLMHKPPPRGFAEGYKAVYRL